MEGLIRIQMNSLQKILVRGLIDPRSIEANYYEVNTLPSELAGRAHLAPDLNKIYHSVFGLCKIYLWEVFFSFYSMIDDAS